MQACRRVLSGKNLTHAGGPARSFGGKSHPCGRACAFFWEENAPMRDGWRALSGKIFHPCERADTIFWEEISLIQVDLRVLSRKKSHPCRRVARAFGNDIALFERGRRMCPRFLGFAIGGQTSFAQRFEANGFSDKRKGTPTRRPSFSLSKNMLSNSNMHKCGIHIHCNGIPGEGSPRKTSHRDIFPPRLRLF